MQITKQNWLATIINFAVTLFFLSIFIVKGGYNAAPALLMLIGLGYSVYALIKKPLLNLSKVDKWLIYSYLFYFLNSRFSPIIKIPYQNLCFELRYPAWWCYCRLYSTL